MTLNLNELEAAVGKMTPGPWHWSQGSHRDATLWLEGQFDQGVLSCICSRDGDSMFPDDPDKEGIVALRNAAPELIAAAREREELAAMLRECAENCHMPDERRKRVEGALAKVGTP
jgi:hypothetical protein